MASLTRQGDIYSLVWTDSSRDPEQVRESLKTTDRTEAKRRKARLENRYYSFDENGKRKHDPWKRKWYQQAKFSGTLCRAVESFLAYKSEARGREGWNAETAKKETYVMRNFADIIGDKKLSDITREDLKRYYYRPSANSPHTRNSDYISINTFLNWCIDRGLMKTKPEFRPEKPQDKLPKFIRPEDFARLISWRLDRIAKWQKTDKAAEPNNAGFWIPLGWMVLAGTGIRPIELSQLKVSHVEGDHLIIGEDFTTKVKAERSVPLLYEAEQAVQILTDPNFRSKEPFMSDSEFLLGRTPRYAKQELSRDFSISWADCFPDKPKRTLYNLKNTFAARFLCDETLQSPGMRLVDLKNILGHSSLETTQRYLQAIPYGVKLRGTIWDHAYNHAQD